MSYYNQNAETNIIVDGSPFGLGAILNQKQSDGNFKPVAYASRTLSPVERRYSQTEREALSVYWVIKRFNMYLYGMCFTVYTDHKPLERIFTSVHEAPARIQKWVLDLQQHEFVVKYLPGHLNAADILSRSPGAESYNNDYESTEQFVCYVAQNSVPKAMTIAEIQEASEKDKTICKIRECIEKNKWTKEGELKPYFIVRKDLTVHESIILKGRKLVIPRKLRQRILQLAHESHQGVLKTKQLLREKVWWPRMDKDLEEMIKTCHACQIMANPTKAPPVNTTKLPDRPWKKLGIDLTGPFTNNEYLLVVIDYYSRFPEVEIVRSITSATIINKLRKIFAVHGICNELVSIRIRRIQVIFRGIMD